MTIDIFNIQQQTEELLRSVKSFEKEQLNLVALEDFGATFLQIRNSRNITLDNAAALTGLSRKTIRKIEQDPAAMDSVKFTTLKKMASLIGVDLCAKL